MLSYQKQKKKLQVKYTGVAGVAPPTVTSAHDSQHSNSWIPGNHVSWECRQMCLRTQRVKDGRTTLKCSLFVVSKSGVKAANVCLKVKMCVCALV